MKYFIFLFINLIVFSFNLFSQNNIDKIISEIEKNNTSLLALRKKTEAQKIENKTNIFLQNPEIEFNYLWSNPTIIGNRTDISISQSFDFPTAYTYKNQISDLKNQQADLEYLKQQKAILLQSRLICINLIYINALNNELTKRLNHAQIIADAAKAKFNVGESNIIDYNKSQLYLLHIGKLSEKNNIERLALLSELSSLNGGNPIEFNDSVFPFQQIDNDFEKWYVRAEQKNPVLSWIKQETEISRKQSKLNIAMSLPKFKTGYMSEKITGQEFRGLTLGFSLPLWENKNKVKSAKAYTIALENANTDNRILFYNQLKSLHSKAIAMQKNLINYRSALTKFDNTEFLKKASEKGEISLINYISELSIYYENTILLLESERDLNKTLAELNQYL